MDLPKELIEIQKAMRTGQLPNEAAISSDVVMRSLNIFNGKQIYFNICDEPSG